MVFISSTSHLTEERRLCGQLHNEGALSVHLRNLVILKISLLTYNFLLTPPPLTTTAPKSPVSTPPPVFSTPRPDNASPYTAPAQSSYHDLAIIHLWGRNDLHHKQQKLPLDLPIPLPYRPRTLNRLRKQVIECRIHVSFAVVSSAIGRGADLAVVAFHQSDVDVCGVPAGTVGWV